MSSLMYDNRILKRAVNIMNNRLGERERLKE